MSLRLQRDGLYGDLKFPKSGTYPEADLTYELLRDGILADVSVGFIPLGGIEAGPGGVPHYRHPVELVELSACNIGANRRAQVVARHLGLAAGRLDSNLTLEVSDWGHKTVSGDDPIEVIGPTGKRLGPAEVEALINERIATMTMQAVDEVVSGVHARLRARGR